MQETEWELWHFVDVEGKKRWMLWIDNYEVNQYDHFPSEEEVGRDWYTFDKEQGRR